MFWWNALSWHVYLVLRGEQAYPRQARRSQAQHLVDQLAFEGHPQISQASAQAKDFRLPGQRQVAHGCKLDFEDGERRTHVHGLQLTEKCTQDPQSALQGPRRAQPRG